MLWPDISSGKSFLFVQRAKFAGCVCFAKECKSVDIPHVQRVQKIILFAEQGCYFLCICEVVV